LKDQFINVVRIKENNNAEDTKGEKNTPKKKKGPKRKYLNPYNVFFLVAVG